MRILFIHIEKRNSQMANATVTRIGQINAAGDEKAIFLKIFSGMTMGAFNQTTQALQRTIQRSISSGKTAQFPASGRSSAAYHTVGTELVGTVMNHAERNIAIDDMLISHHFLAVIDEAMNHYDVRATYASQMGEALAVTADQNILQVMVLAARSAATVTGLSGGSSLINANYKTVGATLLSGMFDATQALDEKDVPQGGFPNGSPNGRFAYLLPAQYYLLAQETNAINRDFGGAGSIADGTIFRIAGLDIIKTNNLPTTNIATGPSAYQGDFTATAAVISHPSAVGTTKLIDLRTEMGYDIRRQGTLLVAKYAIGHGILRPESAVELKTV
jgi:hypothetical protein